MRLNIHVRANVAFSNIYVAPHSGTINAVVGDGTYNVTYLDGDKKDGLRAEWLQIDSRPKKAGTHFK